MGALSQTTLDSDQDSFDRDTDVAGMADVSLRMSWSSSPRGADGTSGPYMLSSRSYVGMP